LARRQAAHEDVALRRAVAGLRDVGQILDVLIERLDVELTQRVAGERLHRHRHVLDVLRDALRRDDDFGEARRVVRAGCGGGLRLREHRRGMRAQDGDHGPADLGIESHAGTPLCVLASSCDRSKTLA
jgi:hypothetical protein